MRKNYVLALFCALLSLVNAQENRPKIGLVLSGGGAKGYAHVGVLEELEKAQIPIDYIGGTSMGAIVGGLYASGYSASDLKKILKEIDFEKIIYDEQNREDAPFFQKQYEEKYLISLTFNHFKLSLPKSISKGHGTLNTLVKYLQHTHDNNDFSQLNIPFLCIATNLETGKQKVFKEGFLPQVVFASGAYPTLFAPVKIDSAFYIDGGVVNNYPVQEVKDMGADIIIGVDLGEGLMKEKDIKNVANILEQIVSYGIESKTEEQRKKVDIAIKPNIVGFSVMDFEAKDTLISIGKKAVLDIKPQIDSLSKIVGKHKRETNISLIDDIYLVDDVNISGLKSYTKNYVLGKMGIKFPQAVKYDMILKGINALYSTGNFKEINNRLEKDEKGNNILYLDIVENTNNLYVKAGLHYDELFKSSLLLNFTAKNIISINTTLSVDLVVGDKPRYYVNYFVDNGIKPSFGLNSAFQQFSVLNRLKQVGVPNLNYDVKTFKNQFYIQSTLKERYAVGLGFEHQYLKIETQNLSDDDSNKSLVNNHYYTPYSFVKIDNRDHKYYPTKGMMFDGEIHYIVASSEKDFDPTLYLKSNVQLNFPLGDHFAIQTGGRFNTYFSSTNIPNGLNFNIGGLQQQLILNSSPFYGLNYGSLVTGSMFELRGGVQYKFLKKNYLSINANILSIADKLKDLNFVDYKYQGYGVTYSYDSPFGPLSGTLSYSPQYGKVIPYVSLGYWF
ncbi:patatin-like phospholipase family protein [Ornithobacterium rhinotracheale]|uniref:patatin-like phospholipase family protein n=2 Tax=Ornithobacterium rhinotracheale TaxID=28251 RepID=UPI001FF16FC8|nr:patatin-like phospholipase family protein [Ornithobacterium rhinotracheale]MCK0199863.1 patatin-like phospholipase family protein [Ornithobacterium rhinotracheale]